MSRDDLRNRYAQGVIGVAVTHWDDALVTELGLRAYAALTEPMLSRALNCTEAMLRANYEGEQEWYLGEYVDHLYPSCPGLRRTGQTPKRGSGSLYPEAGDTCGWCVRVWRARRPNRREDDVHGVA